MQSIFRVLLIVVECGTTVSGGSWCQICTYPTQSYHQMSVFPVYVISKIRIGETR